MKKSLTIILTILLAATLSCCIVACSDKDSGTDNNSVLGRYYFVNPDGTLNMDNWVELQQDGVWVDDAGDTGTYVVDGENITINMFNIDMFDGTIKNGEFTIMIGTYRKEGATPSGGEGGQGIEKTYTVTYDSQGGSAVASMTVREGDKLTAPLNPTRMGYLFAGWYTDKNCSVAWDFSVRTATEDITLYAKWIVEEGKILSMSNAQITDYDILMVVDESVEYVPIAEAVSLGGNATWKLYYDRMGQTEIPTKMAAQMNGVLNKGDNVFYILTTTADGKQVRTYTLTVHRRKLVTVRFYGNNSFLGSVEKYTYNPVLASDISSLKQYGYTINGWKDENRNDFVIGKTLVVADMNVNSVATPNDYTITYNAQGGTMNAQTASVKYDSDYTLEIPQKTGNKFLYWYTVSSSGAENQITTSAGESLGAYLTAGDITVYAKWELVQYDLELICNPSGGGSMQCNGYVGTEFNVNYNQRVTLTAVTNSGYTFLGLYDGSKKVTATGETTYTFNMPAENKTYTAKWIRCPVTLEKNISEAGNVSGVERTILGAEATITATTNAGYTWLGWYDGETKVSEGTSLTYTFTMPAESKIYTAKWCKITLSRNNTSAGTISGLSDKYNVGDEVTVTATTNAGYTWLGWYDGETKVSEGTSLTYTFTMPAENKTYTAKFEKCTSHTPDENCICTKCSAAAHTLDENCICTKCSAVAHTPDENCVCTVCGKTAHGTKDGAYCRHGNAIYFGTYPQTQVTDSTTKSALTSMAGTLPTSSNSQAWPSYGYYISGSVTNFMWYIDLSYNGEKYRGVYFTSYRPYYTTWSSSTDNSYQDDNGYSTSTVYWFKYEPIKWRILSKANGEALILCETIIDSQQYDYDGSFSSNYANSTIRAWLNDTFYNTAFTDLQKEIIQLTTVDNSARSTNPNNNATAFNSGTNAHACANTEDYIFLLSEQEVTNSAYGFSASYSSYDSARQKKNTDYAKCQGVGTRTDGSYAGNGSWWLRSPYYRYSDDARYVYIDGYADNRCSVYCTYLGVVPALKIRLS